MIDVLAEFINLRGKGGKYHSYRQSQSITSSSPPSQDNKRVRSRDKYLNQWTKYTWRTCLCVLILTSSCSPANIISPNSLSCNLPATNRRGLGWNRCYPLALLPQQGGLRTSGLETRCLLLQIMVSAIVLLPENPVLRALHLVVSADAARRKRSGCVPTPMSYSA